MQGTTTTTFQYNVAAEQSATFNLSGLSQGNDAFSAKAYNVACANSGSAMATYVSDWVTVTVTATPTTLLESCRRRSEDRMSTDPSVYLCAAAAFQGWS